MKKSPFFINDAIEIETKLRLEYTKYFNGYKVSDGSQHSTIQIIKTALLTKD
jgi:hypothetical protein